MSSLWWMKILYENYQENVLPQRIVLRSAFSLSGKGNRLVSVNECSMKSQLDTVPSIFLDTIKIENGKCQQDGDTM